MEERPDGKRFAERPGGLTARSGWTWDEAEGPAADAEGREEARDEDSPAGNGHDSR
jgi:hypothetical protein